MLAVVAIHVSWLKEKKTATDAPRFGIPVLLVWLKRIWRCAPRPTVRS